MSDRGGNFGGGPGADAAAHHHHHHHHYYRDAGAGERPSPNPYRLGRSRRHRIVAGVIGGFAEYFGWRPWKLRFVAFLLFFPTLPIFVPLYVLCAVFMPVNELPTVWRNAGDERFWRTVSTRPKVTMTMLRHKYRAVEGRIAELEYAVTSDEYRLQQAFRDLERTRDRPAAPGQDGRTEMPGAGGRPARA